MMSPVNQQQQDERFMRLALKQARQAQQAGEIPVGAVLVADEQVISYGFNACIAQHDPTAHAEVAALRHAALKQKNYRLENTTLYVTLEPCLMCCGALLQARIARLVFAAREPRTGAVVSIHESLRLPGITHHVAISEGVLREQAAALLQEFFSQRRGDD